MSVKVDERVKDIFFTDDTVSVCLVDGRIITVPLTWYPRLLSATTKQREQWKVCRNGEGIYWEDIDETLNTEDMLRGAPALEARL